MRDVLRRERRGIRTGRRRCGALGVLRKERKGVRTGRRGGGAFGHGEEALFAEEFLALFIGCRFSLVLEMGVQAFGVVEDLLEPELRDLFIGSDHEDIIEKNKDAAAFLEGKVGERLFGMTTHRFHK